MRYRLRYSRLIVCLVNLSLLMTPVWAGPLSDLEQLSLFEETVFGHNHVHLSEEKRLEALEKNLFGKPQAGTIETRLKAIGKLVGTNSAPKLMPEAPSLDRPSQVQEAQNLANDRGDVSPSSAAFDDRIKRMLKLAIQLNNQGDKAQAEQILQHVLQLDPQNSDAHFSLGTLAEERLDLIQAQREYRKALQSQPADREIQQALSQVEHKIKAESTGHLTTSGVSTSKSQETGLSYDQTSELKRLCSQAAQSYKAGQYPEAVRLLEEVEARAPNEADVQYALAECLRAQGNLDLALNHMNRAVSLDPGNQRYRDALASLEHQPNLAANPAQQDNAPAGQITPMQPESSAPYAYSPGGAAAYGFESSSSRWGGGSVLGMSQTRLRRAATASLAGAALGAVLNAHGAGGYRTGAMRGALFGGMAGLLFGGY